MGIVEPIDLSNEIAKWKSAVYGKDVRAANTSAFEKIQTSVNGTVENVNQAAENAQNASKNAQDAVDRVQGAIDTATKKAEEAAASQLEAQKSETAAGEYKTAAGTSAVNAAKSAERAEAVKEQLGGFDGTAKTVKATDTYGIIASAMGESNAQALIDAVTNQVMNELLKKSQVVNNLLATIAGNALDAVQGKALSDKIVSLEEAYAQLNSEVRKKAFTVQSLVGPKDINAIVEPGIYYINSNPETQNLPVSNTNGMLFVIAIDSNNFWQYFREYSQHAFYGRYYSRGSWVGWVAQK